MSEDALACQVWTYQLSMPADGTAISEIKFMSTVCKHPACFEQTLLQCGKVLTSCFD
jgi:hypothetical protein